MQATVAGLGSGGRIFTRAERLAGAGGNGALELALVAVPLLDQALDQVLRLQLRNVLDDV